LSFITLPKATRGFYNVGIGGQVIYVKEDIDVIVEDLDVTVEINVLDVTVILEDYPIEVEVD